MNALATWWRRRRWQAQQSAWLLLPLLGLAWVGLGYVGLRARRRAWVLSSVGHLAGSAGAVTAFVAGGWWTVLAVLLLGATWGTGLVQALLVNPRWLRERAALSPLPAAPWLPPLTGTAAAADLAPSDLEPAALAGRWQQRLGEVVDVAAGAGTALPPGALELVGQVRDAVEPVLARVGSGRLLGAEQLYELEAIVAEHLPAALERYLSLPPGYAQTGHGTAGTCPADDLLAQLRSLVDLALQVQEQVHEHDARELRVQAAFLDAKLRRSDLAL